MSPTPLPDTHSDITRSRALVFVALGDRTRLVLVIRLASGESCSISTLAEDSAMTRQAITKHLRVLEGAGVVRSVRRGRENQFALNPDTLNETRDYLDEVSARWDNALARLKRFVER